MMKTAITADGDFESFEDGGFSRIYKRVRSSKYERLVLYQNVRCWGGTGACRLSPCSNTRRHEKRGFDQSGKQNADVHLQRVVCMVMESVC